jgi:uncharacterized protein (DUF488 family)
MNQLGGDVNPGLFTVGHSNHSLEMFVELLKRNRIQILVDARSYPYSKYVPHFNREALHSALDLQGMKYFFLGKELGGRPDEEEFYDDHGFVLYGRLSGCPAFLEGIERLETGSRRFRVAIMCSEEDPAVCHRYLLVSRVLVQRGATVYHIRGDGRVQPDAALKPVEAEQGWLFDLPAETTWKSLQSVLRKKRPSNSSSSFEAMGSKDWLISD